MLVPLAQVSEIRRLAIDTMIMIETGDIRYITSLFRLRKALSDVVNELANVRNAAYLDEPWSSIVIGIAVRKNLSSDYCIIGYLAAMVRNLYDLEKAEIDSYRLRELSDFLKVLADTTISLEAKMLRRL